MKTIYGDRGSGKTEALVAECRANDGLLIVSSYAERIRIAEKYDMPREQIKVWSGDLRHRLMGLEKPIYLDNADWFLEWLCNDRLVGMTIGAISDRPVIMEAH